MSFASPRPILDQPAWAVPMPPAGVEVGGIAGARGAVAPPGIAAPAVAARPVPAFACTASAPGLRLLPASGFAWSGPQGQPRTRSDHALVWRVAGHATLRLPRSAKAAAPLLFLPAGTAFALEPSPGAEGMVLLLGRDLAAQAARPFPAGVLEAAPEAEEAAALQADLSALAAEAAREDAGGRAAVGARLDRIASRLSRLGADCPAHIRDPLVGRFMALAARDLPRGRSLEDIAAMLGCGMEALDRACMAQRGKPARELLDALRIGWALDLLAATDRPLAEIAAETGFPGPAHLGLAVLAATGSPPEVLRPR